jgi:membrane protein required for colicin V production
MNILDLFILGLMTFFLIKGIFRGFFREISSLAGIVFGFLIGIRYRLQMANFLDAYLPFEKPLLILISIIILLLLVVIASNLLGAFLHNIFKRLFIGWLDRGLGIGFALVKGIIISYVLIALLNVFMPTSPLITESKAVRMARAAPRVLSEIISADLFKTWKKEVSKGSEKIGEIISEGKEAVKSLPEVLPDKGE